jgi:predicted lipoprotein with Yx(FWY)xxD motif
VKIPALAAVSAVALLTLTACGSSSSNSVANQAATGSAAAHSGSGLSAARTSLGKVLVNAQGMTLYTLSADGHNHSTCSAQCLQFWPAVAPTGAGTLSVTAGHTTTPDGTAIATVAGHPVYTFSQDQKPGDVNGEGVNEFGGTWHAVSPRGQVVMRASSPSSGSSSSSTGRGHGY